MKLVTFVHRNATRLGVLVTRDAQEFILDLNRAQPDLPADIIAFLQAGDAALAAAQRALVTAEAHALIPLAEATLLAPVPRPGKIICIGHNYHGHTGAVPPAFPDIFAKFNNVVTAPYQPIVIPRASEKVDYEGELAVVIGKRARYIEQARAFDVIAGYTIFNDVTARDFQSRASQWTLGKSFDTFGPMGPALVTKDEIPDPGVLDLSLTLNGQEMQHANTRQLIFSVPFLIEYITQVITLEPGDVISTGTPSGTGASRQPPVFMKPGDEVRIRIEKIGELVNPVASEK
jgi:2-keto-4-pentenoate hydratase/2-oxohepta-3-ene-1,7-dioic acid hydratase in catechol pathway